MKALISILSLLFVLLLVGCSNLDQETLPVAPELNKMVSGQILESDNYPFLQCFNSVPVQSFNITKSPGSVEVVIAPNKFPKVFKHMFAVLEYEDFAEPATNSMVFIGKPLSNVFELKGIETSFLKNIKVYAYNPENNLIDIKPPYVYLTLFAEIKITEWNDTGDELLIYIDDWNANIGDTFIEIKFNNSDPSDYGLTFIAKPTSQIITVPKTFINETVTGLKMYSLFDNLSTE